MHEPESHEDAGLSKRSVAEEGDSGNQSQKATPFKNRSQLVTDYDNEGDMSEKFSDYKMAL